MDRIVTHDLTKRNQQVVAVDRLNLRVEDGAIYGLVGPFGCGKSVVLRLLAGVVEADEGSIEIDGLSQPAAKNQISRRVGYQPDFFGLYDDMKLWEYLRFFLEAHRISAEQHNMRIGAVLERAGLTDRRDDYVGDLSAESKQRLGLVKTLLHDPAILLLDNPAWNLDLPARVQMRELIRGVAAEGKTVVLASNVLTEVSGLCTHLGIMIQGKMMAQGPVARLVRLLNGSRIVELKIAAGMAGAAAAALEQHPMAERVEHENDFVAVHAHYQLNDPAEFVAHLTQSDIPVLAYRENEINLFNVLNRSAMETDSESDILRL